jgi:hypothetical protein
MSAPVGHPNNTPNWQNLTFCVWARKRNKRGVGVKEGDNGTKRVVWRNENGIQEVHMGGRNEGKRVVWILGKGAVVCP